LKRIKRFWRAVSTREVHVLVCDGRPRMWRDTPDSLTWHRALHLLNTGVICDITTGRVRRWER
jgi:hypothetical protein